MPKVRRAIYLHDDLLEEILSRLPVEAAARLKSVSPSWRRLMSCPYFRSLQCRRSAARSARRFVGFFHNTLLVPGGPIHFKPLSATAACNPILHASIDKQLQMFNGQRDREGFIAASPIQATCNGLVLVGRSKLYVWSPASDCRVRIPSLSPRRLFGLSAPGPSLDSFEIVSIPEESVSMSSVTVYSSVTQRWRRKRRPFPVTAASRALNPGGPASMRRSLHWLRQGSILVFDMAQEEAREMELPRGHKEIRRLKGTYANAWLGAVGGYMYLVVVGGGEMEVWCLENYEGVEWRKVVVAAEGWEEGAPLFFDGRWVAFAAVEGDWRCERSVVRFYDTCSGEWRGSYVLDSYLDRGRAFVPCFV